MGACSRFESECADIMENFMKMHTSNTFPHEIECIKQEKHLDYIEAVIYWCDQRGLDVEYAASMIKKDLALKSKIQVEAENNNVLKKSARLPV